jgi:hypothetical protein
MVWAGGRIAAGIFMYFRSLMVDYNTPEIFRLILRGKIRNPVRRKSRVNVARVLPTIVALFGGLAVMFKLRYGTKTQIC